MEEAFAYARKLGATVDGTADSAAEALPEELVGPWPLAADVK
jgi:hypothetical protein